MLCPVHDAAVVCHHHIASLPGVPVGPLGLYGMLEQLREKRTYLCLRHALDLLGLGDVKVQGLAACFRYSSSDSLD